MKKFLFLIALFTLMGGANSVKAEEEEGTKTPIILNGGKFAECFTPGTYGIQMQGWQQFIAYEDATGVSFNEDSYMQFDLAEVVSNGEVRVTFTFSDASTQEAWWCLGIGDSKDDTSTPYYHNFDNSKYWLKKGLGASFDTKKTLNITKVVVQNFNYDSGNTVVTYKVNGGTICGAPMTIKNDNTKTFGAFSGTFSATTAATNIFKMENFEVGNNDKIVIKFKEAVSNTGGWKLNNNGGLVGLDGKTEYEFDLNGTKISDFTIFNWDANPDPIKISEVYFFKSAKIEATEIYEAPAGTTDINGLSRTEPDYTWNVTYPKELGPQTGWCGDIDSNDKAVAINSYDYLHFVVTNVEAGKKLSLRVFVWDGSARQCLYPHPIADVAGVSDWKAVYYITTPGTYVVDISSYPLLRGFKAGNGFNGDESNGNIIVSQAYVCTGNPVDYVPTNKYRLSGKTTGSASLTAALADANAVYYDATGVTGTDVDLTSVTNPNALFKANSGALSNTNNVIIDGTCANLVLTDGYPFKAPADFTADAASYTTTINEEAGAGTLCLPFAAAIPDGVTAYTLTYTSGDKAAATPVETTISANTPVLLNGSGEKVFTGSGAVSASAANESGALTGVFASASVPTNSYVLQNQGGNVSFYRVDSEDPITIPPFRAYLTAQVLGARSIGITYGGVTNINEVKANKVGEKDVYYNLNGQRVSNPTKGIFIKNGVKVSF